MNGDYIKIMSDGSQCFVKDTEVFLSLYPEQPNVYIRPTIDEFSALVKRGMGDFLGKHIVGGCGDGEVFTKECEIRGIKAGTEIWDLEWCELGEFYFLYESVSYKINKDGIEI